MGPTYPFVFKMDGKGDGRDHGEITVLPSISNM